MEILYEDNHIIAVNKLATELVQKDETGHLPLDEKVKQYLKEKYDKPGDVFLGIVHRIDRPVSGVVMFAKTSKAHARINAMFQEKTIEKTYWAIVKEKPPQDEGTLVHYIKRDREKNKSYAYDTQIPESKHSVTHYKLLAASDNFYLLEIKIETGRHHQIRCQLSKMGCPIKGDLKYGFPRSNPDGGISLHAKSIRFKHPVKDEEIFIEAPLPDDSLWNYFKAQVR